MAPTMAGRRLVRFELPLLAFLLTSTSFTHGFASNLVITTIGCMTDLSTEEVIMNNEVKNPADSDFPKMHLVVLDASHNHLESPYHYPVDGADVSIAFVNPYSEDEFSEDLQFVMEVEGPASFVDGGTIGCDGNIRVAARLADNNGVVSLKIADPAASLRVWGGWATGHNSVRLVPDLILEPAPPASMQRQEKEEASEPEEKLDLQQDVMEAGAAVKPGLDASESAAAALPKKNVLEGNDDPKKFLGLSKLASKMKERISRDRNLVFNDANTDTDAARQRVATDIRSVTKGHQLNLAEKTRRDAEEAKNRYKSLAQKLRDDKAAKDGTIEIDRHAQPLSALDREEELRSASYLEKKRKISDQQSAKHRKHLEAQMREKYARADNVGDLDLVSFGVGCGFFVLSVGAILLVYGRKRDKGRRDL